ncbi:hypothetical protein ABMA27_010323 [Loxostege sticticalis]|uniref:Integrase catalytic domain-containing protein n=1 Tax=Loxostege sticticalis TaxID=481309 RepID=A0ABR3H5D2_LOXSC
MIDRATGWPEAVPLKDIRAESISEAVYVHWISRFGCPARITTDQGRQFESHLFSNLTKRLGISKIRTTAYHPQANGMVERWHRTLKSEPTKETNELSTLARGNTEKWIYELPTVLLGLRASLRDDTSISAAELVYGTTLKLPGDFFEPTTSKTLDSDTFLHNLRNHLRELSAVPRKTHTQSKIFVHPALQKCTHVFVRCDHVTKPLTPPYSGPFKVIEHGDKYFKIQKSDVIKTISIDRLKPAFLANNDTEIETTPPNKNEKHKTNIHRNISDEKDIDDHKNKEVIRTRSGRQVRPTVRFMT